ncbi:DUF7882 family protein [Cryobacterium sp. W22_MBD10_FK3]|uniref:DUF7882 family protein n=1 Tax=Cryobacterium sp. W22_MBD10_FK3 TaxID=3240273 RepID=UPI003F93CFD7
MGTLIYNSRVAINFDDTVLAHLEIVIGAKLRLHQSFNLTCPYPTDTADSRTTIWLHPSIPLQFLYTQGTEPTVDKAWIDELFIQASSTNGLTLNATRT